MTPRTAPEVEASIVAGYQAGDELGSVAATHGVSLSGVHRILRRAGVAPRGPTDRRLWTRDDDRRLRRMARRGDTITDIATELGVVRRTVQDHMDRLGLRQHEPDPCRAEAAALYAELASREAVATRLGVSVRTVSRWLTVEGVQVAGRGRRAQGQRSET